MSKETRQVKLVECPRDAIQGIHQFIPTADKIDYINALIESNLFDCIDFGSFVSPKAVPQMADSAQVLEGLQLINDTKLLAIVANEKGTEEAASLSKIHFLGYPFSISEEFQRRNTNSDIKTSFRRLQNIVQIAHDNGKEVVAYLSMAFGNPYGEEWNEELVTYWLGEIANLGIIDFSLADTTGEANPFQITTLFEKAYKDFPKLDIGAHFHSSKTTGLLKIKAAYEAGCRKFDGAILGFGGCPFATDELVGNIAMEDLLFYFERGDPISILALEQQFNQMIKV
ncbi:hydroxymethylglutaryl-CoA lyase [Sphingobacterium sp. SYP-B4668]|uniref:hydroxymethylglutaryl-CoA lyase n=1 Tax=Sphingobacterium sp. SYP-B4668 TaxID=2996035 RepID=UPI0022DDF778|nr:hydroxymethylglutaryl-CoA lyase [Sphingobacterium sp. SYP-B4668]